MVAIEDPEVVQVPIQEVKPVAVVQKQADQISWEFFIGKGYTPEQTAGILGNLKQEHGFRTSDEAGGLGIAQWLGSRRERLIQRGNHLDLNTQLNFIIEELDSTEYRTKNNLVVATTVEQATIVFQNDYERCGDCRQSQRIAYALEFYNRFR